jgi:hypothetical protein
MLPLRRPPLHRIAIVLLALTLLGCVRETVSCTVLADDDPLCQDPDTGVIDAGTEDAAVEDGAIEDGAVDAGAEDARAQDARAERG